MTDGKGTLAPIVITAYNRCSLLKQLIGSLLLCPESSDTELFIISDAPYCIEHRQEVEQIREYITSISGFKEVHRIYNKTNLGAVSSINKIREKVFESHNCGIFFEDDNIVAPNFLTYMNQKLKKYEEESRVFAICPYNFSDVRLKSYPYDTIFYCGLNAYGVGFWKEKYLKYRERVSEIRSLTVKEIPFDFKKRFPHAYDNLRICLLKGYVFGDTLMTYYMYLNDMVALFPTKRLVENRGYGDGKGLHNGNSFRYQIKRITLTNQWVFRDPEFVENNKEYEQIFKKSFRYSTLAARLYHCFERNGLIDLPSPMKNRIKRLFRL